MVKRGVILDVDGTLVDSNEGQIQAWREALSHFGIETSLDDVRRLVGMGGDQLLPSISGLESESELGARISQIKKTIFQEKYLPDVRPSPGATELLGRLHAEGKRLVVASSTDREGVDDLLRLVDPHRLVREVVSSSDVETSKPAPDLVRSALARLG
ncbi:MAG: HAD family hydrolase, partial [Planctomycetota bacterium]